jgi:hypothetical protein
VTVPGEVSTALDICAKKPSAGGPEEMLRISPATRPCPALDMRSYINGPTSGSTGG